MDRSLYLGYCEEIFSFPHWAVLEIELGSQHTPSPCSASKPCPQPLLLLFLVLNIAAEKSYGTLGFCFISWYYKPTKTKQTKERTKDFWKPHTWLTTHMWPITVAILWGTSSLFSSPFSSCLFPSAMWLLSVLVCFLLLIKKTDPKQPRGRKGLLHLTAYGPPSREIKAGTEEETAQRNAVDWLAPHVLLNLLPYTPLYRATCPRVQLPTVGCALPHQPLIKEMPNRFAHQPICWTHFLS